jgi:hypothetical protein
MECPTNMVYAIGRSEQEIELCSTSHAICFEKHATQYAPAAQAGATVPTVDPEWSVAQRLLRLRHKCGTTSVHHTCSRLFMSTCCSCCTSVHSCSCAVAVHTQGVRERDAKHIYKHIVVHRLFMYT